MQESVFTKIIKGEIPCHKIYEDDTVLAFLDIAPMTAGHALVILKQQIDHLWDVDDASYMHLMEVAKRVANRQREVLQPKRVGMAVEGFAVPHVHVHVFPLNDKLEEAVTHKISPPSDDELAIMAKMLAF